jgi:hypothetical protein
MLAARMASHLGRFGVAREHLLAAIAGGIDLNQNFAIYALSALQRYSDAGHPDFALFEKYLNDPTLAPAARATIRFALGKAYDDTGNRAAAAAAWAQANGAIRKTLSWSASDWMKKVERHLNTPLPPPVSSVDGRFVPVFIVGLPRSGTSLLADRLARDPRICNRGELAVLPYLNRWLGHATLAPKPELIARQSHFAVAQLRQDDPPADFYIDKNPLNFRLLGLVAAVLPHARILYCKRDPRDNALSIWSQFFTLGNDSGYAYDLRDIATLSSACERLMEHWQRCLPLPIMSVEYEQMVRNPQTTLNEVRNFLGLPPTEDSVAHATDNVAIATASAWQARQPVHTRSIGRWREYESLIPELGTLT